MSISGISNSGLLQLLSWSNLVTPTTSATTASQGTAESLHLLQQSATSTAEALDTYTPSSQSSSTAALDATGIRYSSTATSSMATGVPQAVYQLLANENDQVQSSWSQLAQNLVAGNLTAAQSSLTTYTQTLAQSNYGISSLTAPTAQFSSDLTALGTAIQSGNATAAMAAFNTASTQAPSDVAGAMGTAVGQVQRDETQSMQEVVATGGLSSTDMTQLAKDMASLSSVQNEAAANVSDYLVSQGYSASDANAYANAIEKTDTTISSSIDSSVSTSAGSTSASASTQVGISVSQDAAGDLTFVSSLSTDATAEGDGAASTALALVGAQIGASNNIANWIGANGYTPLDANAYSSNLSNSATTASTDASATSGASAATAATADTGNTALWIKALSSLLASTTSTSSNSNASATSNSASTLSTSEVSASSIAIWNHTHALLESTLEASSYSYSSSHATPASTTGVNVYA